MSTSAEMDTLFEQVWHTRFVRQYEEMQQHRHNTLYEYMRGKQWIQWEKEIDPDMQLDEGL